MKQSLLKGTDIFSDLSISLNAAKSNIYVVSAWFTDQSLLDILITKAKANIDVSVIIGDNKDNLKLDFSELESVGGKLKRVKGKGYGMMHQKYCIIDKNTAFHGSYNWTVNARRNNSESVIKTDIKSTIEDLLKDFNELSMENETLELPEEKTTKNWLSLFKKKSKKDEEKPVINTAPQAEKVKTELSVDDIFRSIISAEIKKTNRNEIKEKAYDQAKEVSGDYQVITNFMDSLYHLFVSDKKENDLNKEILINKIDDRVAEFTQNINTKKDEKINSVHIENHAEEKKLEFQKTDIIGTKNKKETEKKNILETTIVQIEKNISNLKDKVSELNIAFVKPKFKYHEFIPILLFFLGLSVAMVLFYSSSAYIMLYSYDDAMEAVKAGISVNPQVYEANAWAKANSKGGTALFYISIFVFIPFAIAYVAHNYTEKGLSNTLKKYSSFLVVVLIDIFIALKVSKTIEQINFLSKGIAPDENKFAFLWDINFWLVFFLGAIPFFFLAGLMNKLIQFFAERSTQVGRERMLIERKLLKEKIDDLEKDITTYEDQANRIDLDIEKLKNELNQLEQALIYLPKELDTKITQTNQEANNEIADIRKKADVYKNDIENDNIQISLSSLKDRVSAFIEGWNEWLHDEYATEKAVHKSQEAIEACDQWLADNMKKIESL